MIRAYQEIYLSNAQAALGDAFDYAVNVCHIPGEDFVTLLGRLGRGLLPVVFRAEIQRDLPGVFLWGLSENV